MKKLLFACFMTTLFVALISCSEDSPNDPDDLNTPGNVDTYLSKEVINDIGFGIEYTYTSMYFYDNSKRLSKIVSTIYRVDGPEHFFLKPFKFHSYENY